MRVRSGRGGSGWGVLGEISRCSFFFSSRRRHTRLQGDWSSDVCSSDLGVLDAERRRIMSEDAEPPDAAAVGERVLEQIGRQGTFSLKPVINATGVVLHTNLGRAPLSALALERIASVAEGYSNLELDLASKERGSRYAHVEELLRRLTGAEDALVVNNNAAAVLLALETLAHGKEGVVSPGGVIEIGGGCWIPDIMPRSCAVLP